MLSRLKKKSDASSGPAVPAWHPNFRDYEKLPDVKVVRTAFFVNGAAIVVFLALAIYVGIGEWQLYALNGQIAQAEERINRDRKASEQAVALYKRFQAEGAKVDQVDQFVSTRPQLSTLLEHLARTLPENIALDGFELRPNGVSLRMTVRGTPETAAGYATVYLEQLRGDETLTAFDRTKFEFANQARSATSGRMVAEFFLTLNPQYVEGKK